MREVGLDALEVYTVEQVARKLTVSPRYVRDLITGGELEAIRIGRLVRVTPQALQAFIASRPTTAAPAESVA